MQRLLGVLEQRLATHPWIMGEDYTIADLAILPWVRTLVDFYAAGALVGFDQYPHVGRTLAAWLQRPAVQRSLNIPARD